MEEKELINQSSPAYAFDLFKNENSQDKWEEQKKKLPRNVRYGLISEKTEALIKITAEKYKLNSPEKIGSLAILVRNFMAGELNEEQLKKEAYQRFQLGSALLVSFLEDFKRIIEEVKKIGIEAVKEDLVVLNFQELLEKFPEIKQQPIGVHPIFFPGEEEGQEPWIENWITDYRLRKDDSQKNTILNSSDYLYNNKNAQQLDEQEKEQLAVVLNSFEENKIIYYNTLFEEIDFEIMKLLEKNKKPKAKFNITKFESRPYHDTDEKITFKPKPITKVSPIKPVSDFEKNEPKNVLNLNKYV